MSIRIPPARAFLLLLAASASAQSPQAVCDRGIGRFEATHPPGITVRVAAVKQGAFATRACEAALRSAINRAVVVPTAAQIDIDVLGANLGFGVPVVAFVVQPSPDDPRKLYEVWSLERKPRPLLTLSGEPSYRALDAAFNGQPAIWTTDTAALRAFDDPSTPNELSPPTVALKFDHGQLLDVSAWYRPQYDRQIAALRLRLTPSALAAFRNSDGQLHSNALPTAAAASLRTTRSTLLEIALAYLYSGRPDQASAELQRTWPPADLARIQAALTAARTRGIETQVARVASPTPPPRWSDTPRLYQFLKPSGAPDLDGGQMMYSPLGVTGTEGPVLVKGQPSLPLFAADIEPKAISLWRPTLPPPPGKPSPSRTKPCSSPSTPSARSNPPACSLPPLTPTSSRPPKTGSSSPPPQTPNPSPTNSS